MRFHQLFCGGVCLPQISGNASAYDLKAWKEWEKMNKHKNDFLSPEHLSCTS